MYPRWAGIALLTGCRSAVQCNKLDSSTVTSLTNSRFDARMACSSYGSEDGEGIGGGAGRCAQWDGGGEIDVSFHSTRTLLSRRDVAMANVQS